MRDIEKKLLTLLASGPANMAEVLDMGLIAGVFEIPINEAVYCWFVEHWDQYQKVPTKA
jgi:hypothetical protein